MEINPKITLLREHIKTAEAAAAVLKESFDRSTPIFNKIKNQKNITEASERETLEALTARFARLSDFIFQKLFRTIEQLELTDEGSVFDRLNRMEKRNIIESAQKWYELRTLRNDIAHEYLIESSDEVVLDAYESSIILFKTLDAIKLYSSRLVQ